ncbi:MAG: acetoacetate--CoA ligase, partial [Arenicellales bacterium]|nr:acetoacetate--CoA ligase [Arenicellales bacterium]
MPQPLWTPSVDRIAQSNVAAFTESVAGRYDLTINDYADLHQWSIEHAPEFWTSLWDFAEVIAETRGDTIVTDYEKMPGATWFPDAQLNFAENLLRGKGESIAIVFRGEDQVKRSLTWDELRQRVSRLAQAMRAAEIGQGDRVAAYIPNMPEAVIGMLATASLGAVWSSCSPDFGVQGVLDRFGQIEPKILIGVDGYFYNGKQHESLSKLAQICRQLPSLNKVVVVPYVASEPAIEEIDNALVWDEFVDGFNPADIDFDRVPFNSPLYVMYSSGTTGAPKCIVHGVGGTLLQHLKEHKLHVDVKPADRLFYFTTCGWMMWNWLASGLASKATLMLYDGSPFYPDGNVLFDYVDEEGIDIFGTSAKFIDAIGKAEIHPKTTHNLSTLKTILSTGSPLVPEGFDFVYQNIKSDLCLSSISGGTDIISCFVGGNPTLPVWRGEVQCLALGQDVKVLDENGEQAQVGEKGELACANSFPSMPIYFWNDPDGSKYKKAYFEKVPNVWCHGDYVALTEHGGMFIYGRSDAVLNPGGVRIGTAEIYRQAEKVDDVVESLVIGQRWEGDVRVVLFVRLREGVNLDGHLIDEI